MSGAAVRYYDVLAAGVAAALAFLGRGPMARRASFYPIQTKVHLLAVVAEAVEQRVALGRQATVYAALMAGQAVFTAVVAVRAWAAVVSAATAEEAQSVSYTPVLRAPSHRLIQGTYKCPVIPAYGRSPSNFKVAVKVCGLPPPARQPLARLRLD